MWGREEEYLTLEWDLKDAANDLSTRADFVGKLEPSAIDANIQEMYYSPWKYTLRQAVSWIITLAFCLLDFLFVVLWLNLFHGEMTLGPSIVQAVMIQVFTQTYNWMAEALTLAENHKYQEDFYSSYLKKMFIFQFVNQYSACLYIAVKQQFNPRGCVNDDCVGMIRNQLPTTLLVLAVMRVVQVVVQTLQVKIALWLEARAMAKAGLEAPVYSFVEEQSKYGQFRIREQIEVMTQLTLTLGYVLIFGAVAPIIVPLCFIVFMVQVRAGAVLLTTAAKRTVPRVALGIGPWRTVVRSLLIFGVLFSAYLLVQFGPLFKGTQILTKLSCMCAYVGFILLTWVMVDMMCPEHSRNSEILAGRREYVRKAVMQKSEDAVFERVNQATKGSDKGATSGMPWFGGSAGLGQTAEKTKPERKEAEAAYATQIEKGDWADIPKALKEGKKD